MKRRPAKAGTHGAGRSHPRPARCAETSAGALLAAAAIALAPAAACTVEATTDVDAGIVSGPDGSGSNGNGNGSGPDAGTTPDPDAGGSNGNGNGNGSAGDCTAGGDELLTNGDFDASDSVDPWTASGQVSLTSGFPADTTPNVVGILGAISGNPGSARLAQQVAIPSGTTSLQLSFYGCFETPDKTGSPNLMTMSIEPTSGATGDEFASFDSNDDGVTGCGWGLHQFEVDPSSGYDGETAELVIAAETDASREDTFYLDTFSLVAACP